MINYQFLLSYTSVLAKTRLGNTMVMTSLQERHLALKFFLRRLHVKGAYSDHGSNGNKNVEHKSNSAHKNFLGCPVQIYFKDIMK